MCACKYIYHYVSLSQPRWGFDIDEGTENQVFLSVASGIYKTQCAPKCLLVFPLLFTPSLYSNVHAVVQNFRDLPT